MEIIFASEEIHANLLTTLSGFDFDDELTVNRRVQNPGTLLLVILIQLKPGARQITTIDLAFRLRRCVIAAVSVIDKLVGRVEIEARPRRPRPLDVDRSPTTDAYRKPVLRDNGSR